MINLQTKTWGHTNDGEPVFLFRMTGETGSFIELSNLGATWISSCMPDREGRLSDVLLGYNEIEGYINDTFYMGSTIGRFANRISRASFVLGGKRFELEKNDGCNTNHGGFSGLHRKVWDWEEIAGGVRFTLHSPDGEGGYPGNLNVCVEYTFSATNTLTVHHKVVTDAPTYLNLTNHAYFNLSGSHGAIFDHHLRIPAAEILEVTPDFIPTGRYLRVKDTPFDFTTLRPIGERIGDKHGPLHRYCGYNHCYAFKKESLTRMKMAAELYDPSTNRTLSVETTLPGLVLYTGGYLRPGMPGKRGMPLTPFSGVCLETQYFPDAPTHPHFPSCLLIPGEEYNHVTRYTFAVR